MARIIPGYPGNLLVSAMAASFILLMTLYNFNPPVITHALTTEKVIALTVDDGPDPMYSPEIVRILDRYGINATFFVVGEQVEKYPQIVKMEAEAGNEIGNHSYTHNNLDCLKHLDVREEIISTNDIICKYTGQNVNWFRPPRRRHHRSVVREAKLQGLDTILWTSVVETKRARDPEEMAGLVIEQAHPGGIILLHDSRLDRSKTLEALPMIIEGLHKEGYRFVTLSELFGRRNRGI
ncbi:MAG: polysaccharide deacetylase family protein [Firmicutes bacterium HGW-Firmicutes-14]|jgi:peptidoglycan/xylan/chitin deacetylase (PgdA/CDA1 family)|nr:MAG: polysaccharide deacetylase family protein [Firmicutes bacterium HGW-Firmicutes-14]